MNVILPDCETESEYFELRVHRRSLTHCF